MLAKPRIYADFQKLDNNGNAILKTVGTAEDLDKLKISLQEGMAVVLYETDINSNGESDPLEVDAIIKFSAEHNCWVGVFSRSELCYRSERQNI